MEGVNRDNILHLAEARDDPYSPAAILDSVKIQKFRYNVGKYYFDQFTMRLILTSKLLMMAEL